MSVDLDRVKDSFESARFRLFAALKLEGMGRDGAGNAPLSLGEKLIPGTNITIINWRDCRASYLVRVDERQVYMELTAGGVISSVGKIGDPISLRVAVARVDKDLRWSVGKDFDAFVSDVSEALRLRASQL